MKSKFSWIHQKVWLLIVSFRHNSRKSSNFSQNIFLIKSISIDLALAHVVWKTQWGKKKVFNMESCFNIAEEKEDPKSRATIGKGDIRNCFSTKSSRISPAEWYQQRHWFEKSRSAYFINNLNLSCFGHLRFWFLESNGHEICTFWKIY